MGKMIGELMSPALVEIAEAIWEAEAICPLPPEYTDEGFASAIKIFTSALLERSYILQAKEGMSIEDMEKMATKLGEEIRHLIKVYADIDTHTFFKNDEDGD